MNLDLHLPLKKKLNFEPKNCIYTGCPDQIRPNFKIILLPNYKTYRKSEDSFEIVGKMTTKTTSGDMT